MNEDGHRWGSNLGRKRGGRGEKNNLPPRLASHFSALSAQSNPKKPVIPGKISEMTNDKFSMTNSQFSPGVLVAACRVLSFTPHSPFAICANPSRLEAAPGWNPRQSAENSEFHHNSLPMNNLQPKRCLTN